MASTLGVPAQFAHGDDPGVATDPVLTRFWTAFDDPVLAQLVEDGLTHSRDLAQARARLRESRAALRLKGFDRMPTVSGRRRRRRSSARPGNDVMLHRVTYLPKTVRRRLVTIGDSGDHGRRDRNGSGPRHDGDRLVQFGIFFELQLPRPWKQDAELELVHHALEQVEIADRIGIDYVWAVEHHFLEEYSHCSSPEVFLAAAAARTQRIRIGHGIRQVIANYNHPARTAEGIAMLDLVSRGRVDFGIGEGATRLELGGFNIPAKQKRAMSLEAAEQIANMMVMSPYPGFEGRSFSMPCRDVLPKPVQRPHPPMWMACTNRDTIRVAASHGLGALAFSFVDPDEARTWSRIYYDTIRSEQCVPLGHSVNANIAMVSPFSIHSDRTEAVRRGQENFEFFTYAISALVTQDSVPGRSRLWEDFQRKRGDRTSRQLAAASNETANLFLNSPGIGTPEDFERHVAQFEEAGVDQLVLLQQAGRNPHGEICESLELLGRTVLPAARQRAEQRAARKAADLAPFITQAMARKKRMKPLSDEEIPVVQASVSSVTMSETRK
nr:LLM class flavin-dependent oxidoreductase [Panacagrimonas sp.]